MREFKFRAWDKNCEALIIWSEIEQLDEEGFVPFLDMMKDDRYLVMQYTGLTLEDKDVYEHDILLIVAEDENHNEIGRETCVVDFDRQSFVFAPSLKHRGLTQDALFKRYNARYLRWEVIGNIHENPELLNS